MGGSAEVLKNGGEKKKKTEKCDDNINYIYLQ
jgi:hypothetical protein